jgi:hypothetical protein
MGRELIDAKGTIRGGGSLSVNYSVTSVASVRDFIDSD